MKRIAINMAVDADDELNSVDVGLMVGAVLEEAGIASEMIEIQELEPGQTFLLWAESVDQLQRELRDADEKAKLYAMADDDAQRLRNAEWSGSFYELEILIGPYGDDAVLMTATKALLTAAGLEDNLWCNVHSEPERIERDAWTLDDISHGNHLYSLVDLPSGQRVNCGVLAIREDGKYGPVGMDRLDLYLPVEALMRSDARIAAYNEFADDGESLAWRRPIDDWMAQLTIEVGRAVSFVLATIGFEAYGREDYVTSDPQEDRAWGLVLADGTYLPATS